MVWSNPLRNKPVGWKGEPHRHSLARRGISTAKKHLRSLPSSYYRQEALRALEQAEAAINRDALAGYVAVGILSDEEQRRQVIQERLKRIAAADLDRRIGEAATRLLEKK